MERVVTRGFLGIVQHMGQGVHADMVIGNVHAHSLLAHGRLIGVTRRLIVVRKRDDAGTHPYGTK